MKCDYGCGNPAAFTSKTGKGICQPHWTQCPVKKAGRKAKMDVWRNDSLAQDAFRNSLKDAAKKIDPISGLTKGQTAARNALESRKKNICPETGLPMTKVAGIKSAKTKAKDIDPETGLNGHERHALRHVNRLSEIDPISGLTNAKIAGAKSAATRTSKLTDSGLTTAQQNAKNAANTMKNSLDNQGVSTAKRKAIKAAHTLATTLDPDTGKTLSQIRTEKAKATMLKEVDGLTGYERIAITARQMHLYPGTQLYYQGSYELTWLRKFETIYGIEDLIRRIERGPTIRYFDPVSQRDRIFRPDFILDGQQIVEVKSGYIMNKDGGPETLRAKLAACRDQGFDVTLVLDHDTFTGQDIDDLL